MVARLRGGKHRRSWLAWMWRKATAPRTTHQKSTDIDIEWELAIKAMAQRLTPIYGR